MASILEVESLASTLSWNTRISRTRLSTVDGLSMSAAPVLTVQGLDHVLQTVQKLGLYRCPFEELEHEAVVGEGESFRVERCVYNKEIVAVKHVKLEDSPSNSQSSFHRLQSVLLEIQIMRHGPLKEHPNILSALGYGWKQQGESLLPYVVVEYATHGSLRAWLREQNRPVKTRFKIAGDVATGLKALHMCDIVHGDLKLDNIVVVPYADRVVKVIAKLCDFGHSIILRESSRDLKYFGTILYNAPEVELQDTCKIEREALRKCDIWAYGLSVWELFADGARYFDPSWANDPAYNSQASLNPPGYSSTQPRSLSSMPSSTVYVQSDASYELISKNGLLTPASDPGKQSGLGTFDSKHLRRLSRKFIGTLRFPGLTIEKGYLMKLLDNTLQVDPSLRPSQITLLPTMTDWDRSDKGALQGQLAIHTGSAALTFQMFYPVQEYEIPFEYQRQILQNLISISANHKSQDEAASSAFQVSLCNMVGFGTSPNSESALRYLRRAAELKHPVSILFGRCLEQALVEENTEHDDCYTESIIQGFKNQTVEVKGLELRQTNQLLGQTVERFKSYAAFQFWIKSFDQEDCHKLLDSYVITMPFMIRMDLLPLAIAMDDLPTVQLLAKSFLQKKSTSLEDTALIQACRRGNTDIVLALLDAGADPETTTESGATFYHWLFMLGEGARVVAERLLQPGYKRPASDLVNHCCSHPYLLHAQWPLELMGTPLAFAIFTKSATAVDVLLSLGALPQVPIADFAPPGSSITWTPIHLAFKFHLVDVIHLLLDHMSLSDPFVSQDQQTSISTFELARSISHSTMVERMAMHGKDLVIALQETLALLPVAAFGVASADGLTPFMEAIDFSNLNVVKAMLQVAPDLAMKRFIDPEDPRLYTYPVIFGSQIAARRETSLALNIVKLLTLYMPDNYLARDSDGRTALHLSVTGYSTSTSKWLLDNGHGPDICDNNGRTPIHQVRSTASLDVLLQAGADINLPDRSGLTCAHLAALQGLEDLVDGLIYRNANLFRSRTCDGSMGSPLHCAILKQSWRIVSALLKAKNSQGKPRIDIDATDANGDTALHLATRNFSGDIVRALFFYGADANIRNKAGLTPVHLIVVTGDLELLQSFLFAEKAVRDSRHSDIVHVNPSESTKRHLSPVYLRKLESGNWPLIDFDVGDDSGRTPLHTAASTASVEIAKTLVSNGADETIRDFEGNTALHLALLATDELVTKSNGDRDAFIESGTHIDVAAENKYGVRIWDLALPQKRFGLISRIIQQGNLRACRYKTVLTCPDGRQLLHDAIDAEDWNLVGTLLSSKNRAHRDLSEGLYSQAQRKFGTTKRNSDVRSEADVALMLSLWTEVCQNETFTKKTGEDQLRELKAHNCDFELADSLFKAVNAAAEYRAICALAKSLSTSLDLEDADPAVSHRVGHCWCTERIPEISWRSWQTLSRARLDSVRVQLEGLKPEGLQRFESIFAQVLPEYCQRENSSIRRILIHGNLTCLLRLAQLTCRFTPDPDRRIDETEKCYKYSTAVMIPEVREAVNNKDSDYLKDRFPLDPDAFIECCSWLYEPPPSYDEDFVTKTSSSTKRTILWAQSESDDDSP